MDRSVTSSKPYSHSNYRNVIRESDILNDATYREKKAFFEELKLKSGFFSLLSHFVAQLHCNSLKENAAREASNIRNNLNILISQLPSRVQKMTVSVLSVFDI